MNLTDISFPHLLQILTYVYMYIYSASIFLLELWGLQNESQIVLTPIGSKSIESNGVPR